MKDRARSDSGRGRLAGGLRRTARLFGYLLLVVVVPILLILLLPKLIVTAVRAKWRQRGFLHGATGTTYFIWHARRGWYDFVRNNVLPALPPEVRPIQDRRHGGEELRHVRQAVQRVRPSGVPHPWLVFIGAGRVHVLDLNEALRVRKIEARRSPTVQAELRGWLAQWVRELAGRAAWHGDGFGRAEGSHDARRA